MVRYIRDDLNHEDQELIFSIVKTVLERRRTERQAVDAA
jgi:hypothetical protein